MAARPAPLQAGPGGQRAREQGEGCWDIANLRLHTVTVAETSLKSPFFPVMGFYAMALSSHICFG